MTILDKLASDATAIFGGELFPEKMRQRASEWARSPEGAARLREQAEEIKRLPLPARPTP